MTEDKRQKIESYDEVGYQLTMLECRLDTMRGIWHGCKLVQEDAVRFRKLIDSLWQLAGAVDPTPLYRTSAPPVDVHWIADDERDRRSANLRELADIRADREEFRTERYDTRHRDK